MFLDSYPKNQFYSDGRRIVSSPGKRVKSQTYPEMLANDVGRGVITALLNTNDSDSEESDSGGSDNGIYSSNDTRRRKSKNGRGKGKPRGKGKVKRKSFDSGGTRGYGNSSGQTCLLWSSGIRSGLTVNTRIVTKDYTPLYLSSGWLFKLTDSEVEENTFYNSELATVIYPMIESVISNRIQRYAGRYISFEKFRAYFSALVEALQIYYCVDNVLAYRSNVSVSNVNVGMEVLSSKLTANSIVEYNLLKEFLSTCCCPRNLLSYIQFMCQSYRSSDAPHSSILKLNIGGMFDDDWEIGTSNKIENLLINARTNLIKANELNSYLYQAYPEWLISTPPASSNEACFNKDFMLFWHNQSLCCLSNDPIRRTKLLFDYSQEVVNIDNYIDYQINCKDDEVDGIIFVSNSYLVREPGMTKTKCYWGLWNPLASFQGKKGLTGKPSLSYNLKCLDETGKISSVTNSTVLGASGIHFVIKFSGDSGKEESENLQFGTHGFGESYALAA